MRHLIQCPSQTIKGIKKLGWEPENISVIPCEIATVDSRAVRGSLKPQSLPLNDVM